jgi:hypothetical protein
MRKQAGIGIMSLISFLSPSADGGREQRFGEVFSKRSVQDVCK